MLTMQVALVRTRKSRPGEQFWTLTLRIRNHLDKVVERRNTECFHMILSIACAVTCLALLNH